jgi:hypothetical protein
MIDNEIIILVLVCLLFFYYNSTERFENTMVCSDKKINEAMYKYRVNDMNRTI